MPGIDATAILVLIAVLAILVFIAWFGDNRKTGLPGSK
jgi:hypothetical protein